MTKVKLKKLDPSSQKVKWEDLDNGDFFMINEEQLNIKLSPESSVFWQIGDDSRFCTSGFKGGWEADIKRVRSVTISFEV